MPVTVKVNGAANSLVHKGSVHVSTATIPDVCKTPSPGGPVPIPYPNISQSAMLANGTTTVKADGGMMIAVKGSEFSISNGDEPGVAGGVKSSTFIKESTWILYSFDVKMDGQNACRLSDKKFQNHENTVDLAGAIGPPVPVVPGVDCELVLKKCPVESYDEQKSKKGPPYDGCQSHHVIQNSHFQYPRGTTLKEICPGYTEGEAPCIPLEDGTDTNTAHGRTSQLQKADATRYRDEYKKGKSPTFADARADAKRQLTEKPPGPGLSDGESECVLKVVDQKFEDMCKKGMADPSSFKVRPPGLQGKGLPSPPASGGGVGGAL